MPHWCWCWCNVYVCTDVRAKIDLKCKKFIPVNFQIKQIQYFIPGNLLIRARQLTCFKMKNRKQNPVFFFTFLILSSGVAKAWGQAHFGKGSNRVWLDEVRCTGNELTLEQCPKSAWGEHNCLHSEDAGVSCSPLTGNTTPSSALVIFTRNASEMHSHYAYTDTVRDVLTCLTQVY